MCAVNAQDLTFDAEKAVPRPASQGTSPTRTPAEDWPVLDHADDITVVHTAEELLALEADWTRLADRHARPSHVFQQFGWARRWLSEFRSVSATEPSLAVGVARRNGEAVLILPLFVQRIAGARCLKWLGDPVGQYGDLIIADVPDRLRLISAVFDAVVSEPRADAVFLQRVRDDADIASFLAKLGAAEQDRNEAPYIDLTAFSSFDAYDNATFTRRKQRERKRLRRRLEELGPVRLESDLKADAARAAASEAIVLKRRWLAEKSLASKALTDDRSLNFMAEIAADPSSGVDTRVNVLKSGETTAGAQIGFAYKGTLSMHVIVYDTRFQKAGVGVLHLADMIERAFDEGLEQIDLLAPTADYKRTWATGALGVADHCYGVNRRGRLFVSFYLKRIRPLLKAIAPMVPLSLRKHVRGVAASAGF